jgi:hypothetical protein
LRQLRGRFGLPVYEVDERYSTTEALAAGARCRCGVGLHHSGTVFEESFMTTASSGAQGSLVLDAEALYRELLRGVRSLREPHTPGGHCLRRCLAGERLQQDLGLEGAPGVLSSAMHRDDFAQRGLASSAHTRCPSM